MFEELHLHQFKCFDDVHLPLRSLTLLAGTNGGGKSSVIQALMLLANNVGQREWGERLLLDGNDFTLGTATDVLNQRAARREFMIGLRSADDQVEWTFEVDDRRALSVKVSSIRVKGDILPSTSPLRWLLPGERGASSSVVQTLVRTSWITAERVGPRELLPLHDASAHRRVGARGELAAGLLYWREDDPVRDAICVEGQPPILFQQLRARMQEFFPGCDLRVSPIEGASAVSLRLRSDPRLDFLRPQNVGFGLTQLFPILVALLAADVGDCLLIENPEVHLHPRAQQHIGKLMALVAASGVQVIVETHSDHVLNGVRLAVKQGSLSPEDTALHFFSPDPGGAPPRPKSPTINRQGKLSDWPEGFFDQFDLALSELL